MFAKKDKNTLRIVRHGRVRKKLSGTTARPRLSVYRSLNHIYAQIIDDDTGNTLVSASTVEADLRSQTAELTKAQAAKLVGKTIALRAQEKGLNTVVFDRGGYLYHGRVSELAEGAREAGLNF